MDSSKDPAPTSQLHMQIYCVAVHPVRGEHVTVFKLILYVAPTIYCFEFFISVLYVTMGRKGGSDVEAVEVGHNLF